MSLIKHNANRSALSLLSDLFNSDRFFSDRFFSEEWIPAVNVHETEKSFGIELAAPGMKKEDFRIKAENGMLTISSEKKEEKDEKEKNYTRREFNYRSFSRSFTLPPNTNEDDITAKYEDGVLKLNIAKKESAAPKRKEIQVS
jgi:HSP20 family protein